MGDYRLNPAERAELRAAHNAARAVREACRINAVILRGDGCKTVELADPLLIDPDTVCDYVKRYKKIGIDGLLPMSDVGSKALLNAIQLGGAWPSSSQSPVPDGRGGRPLC